MVKQWNPGGSESWWPIVAGSAVKSPTDGESPTAQAGCGARKVVMSPPFQTSLNRLAREDRRGVLVDGIGDNRRNNGLLSRPLEEFSPRFQVFNLQLFHAVYLLFPMPRHLYRITTSGASFSIRGVGRSTLRLSHGCVTLSDGHVPVANARFQNLVCVRSGSEFSNAPFGSSVWSSAFRRLNLQRRDAFSS